MTPERLIELAQSVGMLVTTEMKWQHERWRTLAKLITEKQKAGLEDGVDDKEIDELLQKLNADAWARGPYGPAPAPFERDRTPWDAKVAINMLRAERDALRDEIARLRTQRGHV